MIIIIFCMIDHMKYTITIDLRGGGTNCPLLGKSRTIFLVSINFYIYFILVTYYFPTNCRGTNCSPLSMFLTALFITFGAISLYTSGNIYLATSLYLIVHRMAVGTFHVQFVVVVVVTCCLPKHITACCRRCSEQLCDWL